ncbi:MAG: hypothetical protein ABSA51_01460 [Anaerolineaceae bacterium]
MVTELRITEETEAAILDDLLKGLLDEESDVEEVAYVTSWLSMNFFTFSPAKRKMLDKRLSRAGEWLWLNIIETIEYLFDEDRDTELILLIQLLGCMPDTHWQVMHLLGGPEVSASHKTAYRLLYDEILTMLDEEDEAAAEGDEGVKLD